MRIAVFDASGNLIFLIKRALVKWRQLPFLGIAFWQP